MADHAWTVLEIAAAGIAVYFTIELLETFF